MSLALAPVSLRAGEFRAQGDDLVGIDICEGAALGSNQGAAHAVCRRRILVAQAGS